MAARRAAKTPLDASTTVVDATEAAIKAAVEAKSITEVDAGAVAALRVLAKKIDGMADVEAGVRDGELVEERKAQPLDNVTVPTFLKYLDALGLTPAGRKALVTAGKSPEGGATGGGRPKSNLQLLREEAQEAG